MGLNKTILAQIIGSMGADLIVAGLAELRKFGTNGHLYIPGVGAISGITAGNYLDSIGTTVASVDGLVGLVLDAAGSVGADLITTTVGIAAQFSAGNLTENSANTNHGVAFVNTTTGNRSEFHFRIAAGTKSWVWAYFEGYTGGSAWFNLAAGTVGTCESGVAGIIKPVGDGYYDCTLIKLNPVVAGNCNIFAVLGDNSTAGYLGTDSVALQITSYSVREVTGIHATQATTGNKPTLRRGLVNLLKYSEQRTNSSVWGGANVVINSDTSLTINDSGYNFQAVGASAGTVYTNAVVISGVTGERVSLFLQDGDGAFASAGIDITLTATPTLHVFSRATTGAFTLAGLRSVGPSSLTVNVLAHGLFAGTITADQILAAGGIPLTTTAPASSSVGAYAWEFDGADDCFDLASVPVTSAGDYFVCFAATGEAQESGRPLFAAWSLGGVGAYIRLHHNSSSYYAEWKDDAGTSRTLAFAVPVGTPVVASMAKTGNKKDLRVNGVQRATDSTALGTTTLNSAAIGKLQWGTSSYDFFKGRCGSGVVVNGAVTPTQALIFERGLNALSGYAAGRF